MAENATLSDFQGDGGQFCAECFDPDELLRELLDLKHRGE